MTTSHTPFALLSLLAGCVALSACGEVDPSDLDALAGDEAGFGSETGDAGTGIDEAGDEAGCSGESSDSSPETDSGEAETGADEPEPPMSRITDMWSEPEGLYVRAVPGDALMQRLPEVAEVMAFFPSVEQSEVDDGVFTSLLDAEGETLMAVKVWDTDTLPDGTALQGGHTIAMFSDWMADLPLALCVTEPCPFDDWPDANRIVQGRLGGQFHIEGVMRGKRFVGSYANLSTDPVTLDEKGFDLLDGDETQEIKRAEVAAMDLLELGIEAKSTPSAPANADWDPCETIENAAQGAAAALGAACCVDTGGLGCFFCFAAAQTLVEDLEDLCA